MPYRGEEQSPLDFEGYETEGELEADLTSSTVEFDPANSRQWWLPLTAEGRGRDATIELLDPSIDEHLRITYSAATGALEISR